MWRAQGRRAVQDLQDLSGPLQETTGQKAVASCCRPNPMYSLCETQREFALESLREVQRAGQDVEAEEA